MARSYDTKDLTYWDEKIREKAAELGLDWYPQEFEICDHNQMLGYMAYSGMPAHYPHWSFGKSYEKLKTLYDHGVTGLPYEMVINSDPCVAYLMRDNTLCLQIVTMAHVYAHNDFFKNNRTFVATRPEFTLLTFKAHADRVRAYVEDPSLGVDKVDQILDAAHSLSLQRRRHLSVRKLTQGEQRDQLLEAARPQEDPYQTIHRRQEYVEPDLQKIPPVPEEDILLFVRDHNPYLEEWQKDLLTIVDEEAAYFIPQIETKIMNEGWASYFHHEILKGIDLPQDLHLEFLVWHNQVVQRSVGGLNPYHLGLKVWNDIRRRADDPKPQEIEAHGRPVSSGRQMMLQAREADRDVSFLRRFLTEDLARELDLFQYQPKGEDLVITKVADPEDWKEVKARLLCSVGMGTIPVIRVHDADFGHRRTLYMVHEHDGRDLELEYAEKTLSYIYRLWGREVALETEVENKRVVLVFGERGFGIKSPAS